MRLNLDSTIEESSGNDDSTPIISRISGPIIVLKRIHSVKIGEIVTIIRHDGKRRIGQVIEFQQRTLPPHETEATILVYEGTRGLNIEDTEVIFSGTPMLLSVSESMLGRCFNGRGDLIDGGPELITKEKRRIHGSPINPIARDYPGSMIHTGFTSIDFMNPLMRGQKLAIFSGNGLPHDSIAIRIIKQAMDHTPTDKFALVFCGLGITESENSFYKNKINEIGAQGRTVSFINLASDPVFERYLLPRMALTAAEYLAYSLHMHVLVVLTNITNYAQALYEIASAKDEGYGRRGYPGNMYSDFASIFERSGCLERCDGSITQIPILTMPNDEITHPIPDLVGYITEGQLVISRKLHEKQIYPPIDVLVSLSRLSKYGMKIAPTRPDIEQVTSQLLAYYSEGCDIRETSAIVGIESLSEREKYLFRLANTFERYFINQIDTNGFSSRSMEENISLAWNLISMIPINEISRIEDEYISSYYIRNSAFRHIGVSYDFLEGYLKYS